MSPVGRPCRGSQSPSRLNVVAVGILDKEEQKKLSECVKGYAP